MSGEMPDVDALESRKRLLVLESEINRATCIQEWEALAGGVVNMAHRARSFGSIASVTSLLVSGFGATRNGEAGPAANSSRVDSLLKTARLACSIWLVLRGRAPS